MYKSYGIPFGGGLAKPECKCGPLAATLAGGGDDDDGRLPGNGGGGVFLGPIKGFGGVALFEAAAGSSYGTCMSGFTIAWEGIISKFGGAGFRGTILRCKGNGLSLIHI